jgi:hypothetical protein
VFLTASVATDMADEEGAVAAPAPAHHFFTKLKAAELHDPEITLAFGGVEGTSLTVMVHCKVSFQLQLFSTVFLQECMGQLAYFGRIY